jgi:hypothetical protein
MYKVRGNLSLLPKLQSANFAVQRQELSRREKFTSLKITLSKTIKLFEKKWLITSSKPKGLEGGLRSERE